MEEMNLVGCFVMRICGFCEQYPMEDRIPLFLSLLPEELLEIVYDHQIAGTLEEIHGELGGSLTAALMHLLEVEYSPLNGFKVFQGMVTYVCFEYLHRLDLIDYKCSINFLETDRLWTHIQSVSPVPEKLTQLMKTLNLDQNAVGLS